jgi:glutamate-1-semialdehyde aminotransferase
VFLKRQCGRTPGTDATSLALRYARAYTGKRKLLRAPGAYHGANAGELTRNLSLCHCL